MAIAAAGGALGEPDIDVRLLTAPDTDGGDVLGADGYIFATPENLAALAGTMKNFFDRAILPGAGSYQWPAVRDSDLRRQRRRECGAADRAHRDGVASAGHRGSVDRVHACADARGHTCAQEARRKRSRSLQGTGCGDGRRPGHRDLLILRQYGYGSTSAASASCFADAKS